MLITSNIADGGDFKALLLHYSTKLNSSTNAQLWHVCPTIGNILLAAVNFSQMKDLSKNVDKMVEVLKQKEADLRQKANFCREHKFTKEEEWLRMKYQIVNEIRFEVELLKSENEFRPLFNF